MDADALLAAVRRKFDGTLGAEEHAWLTHDIAAIYVTAKKTESDRVKLLSDAVKWRLKKRALLSSCDCPSCLENALSHDARIFGVDPDGDVVFCNCFALPRELSPQSIAEHMACLFERALHQFPASPPAVRRWTWVIDMHGFGIKHTDPRTSIELLHLLDCAFPERLKLMLIVDAPAVFSVLWTVVKPLMQAKTVAKIEFVTWEDAPNRYEECFGEAVARRLSAEGTENRDPEAVKTKRWTTFYASDDLVASPVAQNG